MILVVTVWRRALEEGIRQVEEEELEVECDSEVEPVEGNKLADKDFNNTVREFDGTGELGSMAVAD